MHLLYPTSWIILDRFQRHNRNGMRAKQQLHHLCLQDDACGAIKITGGA